MNYNKKELDIVKFNNQFEQYDISQQQQQEKKYKTTTQQITNPKINTIDKNILKMRKAFDFILQKIEVLENPISDILTQEDLTQGTIMLCLFIGLLTMILAGLMQN